MPPIIFANACGSARTRKEETDLHWSAGLAPSLAGQFFRVGVRHYIGTTWNVVDDGAAEFARIFYEQFMGERRATIGAALVEARKQLRDGDHAGQPRRAEGQYGYLWAAYQHYGSPDYSWGG